MVIHKKVKLQESEKDWFVFQNEKLCKHPIIFMLGLHNAISLILFEICIKEYYTCTHTRTHTHDI